VFETCQFPTQCTVILPGELEIRSETRLACSAAYLLRLGRGCGLSLAGGLDVFADAVGVDEKKAG
jgi:hypothetical protein